MIDILQHSKAAARSAKKERYDAKPLRSMASALSIAAIALAATSIVRADEEVNLCDPVKDSAGAAVRIGDGGVVRYPATAPCPEIDVIEKKQKIVASTDDGVVAVEDDQVTVIEDGKVIAEEEETTVVVLPKEFVLDGDVLFGFDQSDLTPAASDELTAVAELLAKHEEARITAVGHTDSTGPEAYNLGLLERRAQAVADYLVSAGIAFSRLEVKGVGEADPLASNDTVEGRAENRRVEIVTGS